MDIWNMPHVEGGDKYYIRKEYTEISELKNSGEKPQIIIQQAPQAGAEAAESAKDGPPQETPPGPPETPPGCRGKKEGVTEAESGRTGL